MAETVEPSRVTSHHMATDLSHQAAALVESSRVESLHMATDLSHYMKAETVSSRVTDRIRSDESGSHVISTRRHTRPL
jgi:hypothetical protein